MAAPASASWRRWSACLQLDVTGKLLPLLADRTVAAAGPGLRTAVVLAASPKTGPQARAGSAPGHGNMDRLCSHRLDDRPRELPLSERRASHGCGIGLEPAGLAEAVALQRPLLRRPDSSGCCGTDPVAPRAGCALGCREPARAG